MNHLKFFGLLVWRSPSFVLGIIISVALCVGTSFVRLLRLLIPAIFSMLPDEYRRIIHLAAGIPSLLPIFWAHFKPMRGPCLSSAA